MPTLPAILLAISIAAASAPALAAPPIKATVDVPDIEQAIELSNLLDSRVGQPIPESANWFEILPGTVPVILTAPHATRPFREGRFRFADGGGTAALAVALHKLCDVTVIHTSFDSPSDPNFYDDNAFKDALAAQFQQARPKFLLDIHGSNAFRPYEVDIGNMNGVSTSGAPGLHAALVRALERRGILHLSDNYFPAARNRTITRFAHQHGVPAMQLEISVTRLKPAENPLAAHRFSETLEALVNFLRARNSCTPTRSVPAIDEY